MYNESRSYNRAYEAYQQDIYRDARKATYWNSSGVLYFQLEINQFQDALDAYSHAIRIDPYIWGVWHNLGVLYERANRQLKDGMSAYARAKELNPANNTAKERLEVLVNHTQDPSIPLGQAPPPEGLDPNSESPDPVPPPIQTPSNSSRQLPGRNVFSGTQAPLPNGTYVFSSRPKHAIPMSLAPPGISII